MCWGRSLVGCRAGQEMHSCPVWPERLSGCLESGRVSWALQQWQLRALLRARGAAAGVSGARVYEALAQARSAGVCVLMSFQAALTPLVATWPASRPCAAALAACSLCMQLLPRRAAVACGQFLSFQAAHPIGSLACTYAMRCSNAQQPCLHAGRCVGRPDPSS